MPEAAAVPKLLVLVRHAESSKNTRPSFSAVAGDEQLTDEGEAQSRIVTSFLSDLAAERRSRSIAVFCSQTDRSLLTARTVLPNVELRTLSGLAPIRSPYPGMTEQDVDQLDPEFMRLVTQYRIGIRSAYDIPRASGEPVAEFEKRTIDSLDEILRSDVDLCVVVGHRSTLTAILLKAARQLAGYPGNWYGHITIPLTSISTLEHDGQRFTAILDLCLVLTDRKA
jgi:broad specificity phosphatase PhoE